MTSSMPPSSAYPNSVKNTEKQLWSLYRGRGRGFNLILREKGSGVEIYLEDDFALQNDWSLLTLSVYLG